MNIFQFDKDYFDDCFNNNDEDNKIALGKLEFWTWILEQQAKRGFHLLPPFINYICNTNEEPPTMLILDGDDDTDGDGVTD